MSSLESVTEGDTITVSVAKREGETVCEGPDGECTITFLETPGLEEGGCEKVTVTVSRTIYSPTGSLEGLLVSPADGTQKSQSSASEISAGSGESGQDDSLEGIAESLIGDRIFEVDGDDESVLSAAKKKAKKQGRDPAIDPRFNER